MQGREKAFLAHRTFSMLLVVVPVHLFFDAATIYTVGHLNTVPLVFNDILHRIFVGTMVFTIYLFYQYISILVEEETRQPRRLDFLAKFFLVIAFFGSLVLPIHYTVTPQGNYSGGLYAAVFPNLAD